MSKSLDNRFQWPIIGHANITSYLQGALLKGKVSQAYLFIGPEHIGKTLVAQNFVNSLVCENSHEGSEGSGSIPCGQCQGCQQVANKIHPDVFWLKREIDEKKGKLKKNISIEQIRQLQNRLSLHSFLNSYKIAVIDEASTLSLEAANSLLKTLEEPAGKTVIILLATKLTGLPQTIISRCQILRFLPVSSKEIFNHLISLKTERKKAKILVALSFGRPGLAINYFSQPDNYQNFQAGVNHFITLLKADLNERFKIVGELIEFNNVKSTQEILSLWLKIWRDLILVKYSAENLVSNLKVLPELKQLAVSYKRQELIEILREINLARRYLEANVNPRLTLENLVLNF